MIDRFLVLLSIIALIYMVTHPEEDLYRLYAASERYENKAAGFPLFDSPTAAHAPPNNLSASAGGTITYVPGVGEQLDKDAMIELDPNQTEGGGTWLAQSMHFSWYMHISLKITDLDVSGTGNNQYIYKGAFHSLGDLYCDTADGNKLKLLYYIGVNTLPVAQPVETIGTCVQDKWMKIYLQNTFFEPVDPPYTTVGDVELLVWIEGDPVRKEFIKHHAGDSACPENGDHVTPLYFGKDLIAIYHSIGFYKGWGTVIRRDYDVVEAMCGSCAGGGMCVGMVETDPGYGFCPGHVATDYNYCPNAADFSVLGGCASCSIAHTVANAGPPMTCDCNTAIGGVETGSTPNKICTLTCDSTKNVVLAGDGLSCVCADGYLKLDPGDLACVPPCTDGQYRNSDSCDSCDWNCATCSGTGSCDTCKASLPLDSSCACDAARKFVLGADKKSCMCMNGYYDNADSCVVCAWKCGTCSEASSCETCSGTGGVTSEVPCTCDSNLGLKEITANKTCVCDNSKGFATTATAGKCTKCKSGETAEGDKCLESLAKNQSDKEKDDDDDDDDNNTIIIVSCVIGSVVLITVGLVFVLIKKGIIQRCCRKKTPEVSPDEEQETGKKNEGNNEANE